MQSVQPQEPRRRIRRNKPVPVIEPIAYTMDQAAIASGRNKKQLYKDIAAGLLRTYKHGRCRMVLKAELERHLRDLAKGGR